MLRPLTRTGIQPSVCLSSEVVFLSDLSNRRGQSLSRTFQAE